MSLPNLAWMDDALCAQVGGDSWFPALNGGAYAEAVRQATAICTSCPVTDQCEAHQGRVQADLSHPDRHGIWAGISPEQRRKAAA